MAGSVAFRHNADSDLPVTGMPAWRSNGGPSRGHPARAWPNSFDAPLETSLRLVRLHVVGVMAQFAGADHEVPGTLGASVQLLKGEQIVFRKELANTRHYGDASDLSPLSRVLADGSSVKTLGRVMLDEEKWRVDLLTLDLTPGVEADRFKFKSLSSPASFSIFDVFVEVAAIHACPFHSAGGGVPLARIGSIVRLGDRGEFAKAFSQLQSSVIETVDLDDAGGQVLTFLAVLTAAMLEMEGSRDLLREQLEAARSLDKASTPDEILEVARRQAERIAAPLFRDTSNPAGQLMDQAMRFVDREYRQPLSDATVARELGLSTSHFRFLFRQATGQPFHQYLIAVRLEKAKEMLTSRHASVGTVAEAVGFGALSHFSRAFTQRFHASPSQIRRGVS
jgi:AraC-like DNA-binding protein